MREGSRREQERGRATTTALGEKLQSIMVDVEYFAFGVDHVCWNLAGDDVAEVTRELHRLRTVCFDLAGRIAARERACGRSPDARPVTVVRDSHRWYIRDGEFDTRDACTAASACLSQLASWTRDLLGVPDGDVDRDTRALLDEIASQLDDEAEVFRRRLVGYEE